MSQYEVIPLDPYGNRKGASVYILASTPGGAERAGKFLLRLFGIKGKFYAKAVPYNPLNDPAMRGYVRAIQNGKV